MVGIDKLDYCIEVDLWDPVDGYDLILESKAFLEAAVRAKHCSKVVVSGFEDETVRLDVGALNEEDHVVEFVEVPALVHVAISLRVVSLHLVLGRQNVLRLPLVQL